MREPPITVTCDCGATASLAYGERWTCPTCGKTWNTGQIPRAGVRRAAATRAPLPADGARALRSCSPLILIPLGVLVDIRFAYLLFLLELAFALMVIPPLRRRASVHVLTQTPSWKLRPE